VAAALGTHSTTELVLMHRVTTLEQVVDQLLSLFTVPRWQAQVAMSSNAAIPAAATTAAAAAPGFAGSFDALATRQLYEQWAGEAAARGRDDVRLSPKPGKD
jgi:hypothetical protein